jgi:hypothetical protein
MKATAIGLSAISACLVLGLAACNKAESPEHVQAAVDKAATEAAENNAKAMEDQRKQEEEAAQDRRDAAAASADKSVAAVANTAVVEAEGDTKVALAKCKVLEGDAQKACEDKAKEHLDAVKDRAKEYEDRAKSTN